MFAVSSGKTSILIVTEAVVHKVMGQHDACEINGIFL